MQHSLPTFIEENSRTLKQYDNHSYSNHNSSVITGYIREFQQTFMWQIPSVVNDTLQKYYFVPSVARLQFAYKLFNIIQTEQYNGQQLFNIVKKSLSEYVLKNGHININDEILAELNELIQSKYITLISFKINFFLFSENVNQNVNNYKTEIFQNNPSYTYQISSNKINEFNQYKQHIQNNTPIKLIQQNIIHVSISETSESSKSNWYDDIPMTKCEELPLIPIIGLHKNEIFYNEDFTDHESTEQYDSEEIDYNSSMD